MHELAGARVLVTGGAGFVGARLVRRLLDAGAEVNLITRNGTDLSRLISFRRDLRLHEADVTDAGRVAAAVHASRPEVTFHLAMSAGHPSSPAEVASATSTSLEGTANLLHALERSPSRKLVHVGSFLEYAPGEGPIREDRPLRPACARGVAKAAASRLCAAFARERRFPAVVLAVFSVYGPGEAPHRLVPTAIRCAETGSEMRLTRSGLRRDLVYVDDVADACLHAAVCETEPGERINVGSGTGCPNEEVVALVERLTGRTIALLPDPHPRSPSDSEVRIADTRKARALLGWEARHSLEEGLARTIAAREGALAG